MEAGEQHLPHNTEHGCSSEEEAYELLNDWIVDNPRHDINDFSVESTDTEPLMRVYGPSEEAAIHNVKLHCEEKGWIIVK